MQNTNLKDNVTGNSTFLYWRDNAMWYQTETGLVFQIPVADLDTAQVLAVEKSMVLMRWIRKHLENYDGV